jgi:DnaJ-class molecular chaperone
MTLWDEEGEGDAERCPVCDGRGIVALFAENWFVPRICQACDGAGIDPQTREKLETLL